MVTDRCFKYVWAALLATVLLSVSACIPTSPEYTVTFIISEGISGSPESGSYTYNEFDAIPYSYEVSSPEYVWPEIYINGTKASAEGSMVVYNHCTVEVRQIDIRNDAVNQDDQWEFSLYNSYGGEESVFRLRFVGESNRSGAFSDTRGHFGTWVISDSKNLTMTFANWDDAVFTGTITSMTGAWTMTSYPDAYSWTATRKN